MYPSDWSKIGGGRGAVRRKALWRWLVAGVIIIACCGVVSCSNQGENSKGTAGLVLYGNVDIREVQLAFQDSGRISRLQVDEGAVVHAGQVLAELDPVRFQLEVERLSAEVKAQAETLTRLKNGSRPQEIEKAKAQLDSAKASLNEAQLSLDRVQILRVTNRISQQEVDSAKAKVETFVATVHAAEDELSLVVEGSRQEDVKVAEASLMALTAARDLAAQRLKDCRLLAPADGIIRSRILETGAMASASQSPLGPCLH